MLMQLRQKFELFFVREFWTARPFFVHFFGHNVEEKWKCHNYFLFVFFALILVRHFSRTHMHYAAIAFLFNNSLTKCNHLVSIECPKLPAYKLMHTYSSHTHCVYLLPVLVVIAHIHLLSTFPCIMLEWEKSRLRWFCCLFLPFRLPQFELKLKFTYKCVCVCVCTREWVCTCNEFNFFVSFFLLDSMALVYLLSHSSLTI